MSHPRGRIQTIVFLRHGVAQHNLLSRDNKRPNLEDPALWDPPLVTQGKVAALHEAIQTWWKRTQRGESIELVITSILTRCLQTATLAFLPPGENGYKDDKEDEQQHSAPMPLICKQDVREAVGKHFPDKRRAKSVLACHWPAVQWEAEMAEHDDAWSLHYRESLEEIRQRVERFHAWLARAPQRNIVVVSYGLLLEALFRTHLPQLLGERRIYNTDAIAVQCVSLNSTGNFVRLQNGQIIHGHGH